MQTRSQTQKRSRVEEAPLASDKVTVEPKRRRRQLPPPREQCALDIAQLCCLFKLPEATDKLLALNWKDRLYVMERLDRMEYGLNLCMEWLKVHTRNPPAVPNVRPFELYPISG